MNIDARPGTYILLLKSVVYAGISIGKLGRLQIEPGYYLYAGSAFGPGGLSARLSHHLKRSLHPHWHIDYLRQQGEIQEVWFTYDAFKWEHQWADFLQSLPSVQIPMPGFGSSDCRCISHFFYTTMPPSFEAFHSLVCNSCQLQKTVSFTPVL